MLQKTLLEKSIVKLFFKQPGRIRWLFILLALIPLGLGTKFYHGAGQAWMTAYAGDIFYPMFWFYVMLFLFPTLRPLPTAIGVFIFSTVIETTQLLSWPILLQLRESFLGRTMVGVSFSLTDIFYYALGCALAVALHRLFTPVFLSICRGETMPP